ncbi:hypothetical protein FRX31_003127 [Thalictrum thalictroides]|uniref:Uncharacterized protein n=1 Tax=Thalictrum thalictroides TaxID=46969 RepID=A0A7J6XE45_THATH|nr:hypothetical protein FRX31_003127 [Thalictrum thalictroides]
MLMARPWKNVLYAQVVSIQSIGRHLLKMSLGLKKDKNSKNAQNKSKNDLGHSMGRRSYAQLHYPEELVEAAEERMASSNFIEEGSNSQLDINSDALSEVFGPDHKNRVCGIGSNISKRQYHRSVAAIIEEVNSMSVAEVRIDVANVKTDVAGVKTDMADLTSMMQVSLQYR